MNVLIIDVWAQRIHVSRLKSRRWKPHTIIWLTWNSLPIAYAVCWLLLLLLLFLFLFLSHSISFIFKVFLVVDVCIMYNVCIFISNFGMKRKRKRRQMTTTTTITALMMLKEQKIPKYIVLAVSISFSSDQSVHDKFSANTQWKKKVWSFHDITTNKLFEHLHLTITFLFLAIPHCC